MVYSRSDLPGRSAENGRTQNNRKKENDGRSLFRSRERKHVMIKMIALDLDNTLLMKDLTVPQETMHVLHRAAAQGVYVVIASGRMYAAAKRYADMIGSTDPVVSCNGSDIRGGDGSRIFEGGFSVELLRELIPLFLENNLYFQLYWGDSIVIERWNEHTEAYPDAHIQPVLEVGSWADVLAGKAEGIELQPSPKALLVAEPEDMDAAEALIRQKMGGRVDLTRSNSRYLEILAPGVSKREGLRILAERLGIRQSEVMACGDNLNDLEMVRWAGVGVAMANAVPGLKEAADYVTTAERSYGVAEAVRKFVLENE